MDFFTEEKCKELIPRAKDFDVWYNALSTILPDYGINTPERVAAFMAQCGHESAGFRVLQENLNYSAEALNRVFPKYFVRAGRDAQEYHRQPEKIANVVYANRMGNGDTESGEGWKYRGRGIIQITGKNNYRMISLKMFDDETLLDNPDLLLDIEYAIHSACWFWTDNKLNDLADAGDMIKMTKRINGGTIGLEDRIKHYEHAIEILTH